MNKPLRRVSVFCGLLVLALLLRVNYVQFVQADQLSNDPHNRRVAINQYAQPRGDVIVGGKAVTGHATTNGSDFKYKRTYTDGPMWAPVTGYASQAYGTSLLEGVDDKFLTGDDDRLFFNRTIDLLTGKEKQGGNVVTTLNAKAQAAAFKGLGDKKGAVAAIDPRTGAILALASTPSYDPSSLRRQLADRREALERSAEGERPRRPDAEPGAAPDLSARFDVQAGHGGGGAPARQGERRRPADDLARPVHAARDQDAAEERGQHPLQERHAAGRPPVLVQHGLRQARRARSA